MYDSKITYTKGAITLKAKDMKQTEESCYYKSYSVCTCNQSEHCNNKCVGREECERYVSENEYFMNMMSGKIQPESEKSVQKTTSAQTYKNLSLGKSKKALKKEAKMEAERNGAGSGFSIADDPRFKELFGGK